MVNDGSFDPSATHLMCLRPSRNEKMLGSIATGKWVLHCMYLRDSEANGNFLDVSIVRRYSFERYLRYVRRSFRIKIVGREI